MPCVYNAITRIIPIFDPSGSFAIMSLGDIPDGGRSLHVGAANPVTTSLAPLAFRESHATNPVPNVPATDLPVETLQAYGSDTKDEKASIVSDDAGVSPDTKYVNGEPVIESGEDVSNFIVDDRDDGDPALTFRSFVLGTIIAGLGAALAQVSLLDVRFTRIFNNHVVCLDLHLQTD